MPPIELIKCIFQSAVPTVRFQCPLSIKKLQAISLCPLSGFLNVEHSNDALVCNSFLEQLLQFNHSVFSFWIFLRVILSLYYPIPVCKHTSVLPRIQECEKAATPTKAVGAKCGYLKKRVSEIQKVSIGLLLSGGINSPTWFLPCGD